jgi:hypothetical protein
MKKIQVVLAVVFYAAMVLAQQTLSNDSVLKLVKAGMGDDLIVNMINSQPGSFALAADDVVALKAGGASDKVIGAMLLKNAGGAPVQAKSPAPAAGLVNEIGVYYKKGDTWIDLEPEVVNFKTGGVLKAIATEGIVKGDVNGHINGAESKTQLKTPVEILIYAPEGVAATEYQLLHLHESGKSREFRTMTGGVFHQSGGATRDAVEFQAKKIAPRTYSLTLSSLKSGEYGIFPPSSSDATGASGRLGKLYTFHVIE